MDQEERIEEFLSSVIDDPRGLAQSVAIRAPYWAHSCLVPPGQRTELEVGTSLGLICRLSSVNAVWRLVRRPTASRATLHGTRLQADAPGVYQVTLELGGFVRLLAFVAVTPEQLDRIGPRAGLNDRLLTLRSRINEPSLTTAALVAALETLPPNHETLGQLLARAR
mgnify:CR=1 FL=1